REQPTPAPWSRSPMSHLFRWTIGRKLAVAFGAVVVLFSAALILAVPMQSKANHSWQQLDRWQKGQDAIAKEVTGARTQQAAQALYAATFDPKYKAEWERGVAIADAGATAADALHDPTVAKIANSAKAADHLHDENVHNKLFPAVAAGDHAAALAALREVDRYVRGPISASEKIAGYLAQRRAASVADATSAAATAKRVTLVAMILGVLLAAAVAI